MAFCNIQDSVHLWPGTIMMSIQKHCQVHDTVGICYQNETDLSPATNALANDSVDSSELRIPAQIIQETYKSRRSLKLQQPISEPYRKKPGSQFSNIQLQIFPGPQSWPLWNVEICFGWSMLLLPQRLLCGWVGTLRWLMTHYQNRRSPIWKILLFLSHDWMS